MLSPCELFEIPYGIKMLTRQLKVDHQKGLPAYLKLCCHAILICSQDFCKTYILDKM